MPAMPNLGHSLQMRAPGTSEFYSLLGDLGHNTGDIGRLFQRGLTGPTGQALCRHFRVTLNEMFAGFGVLLNSLRLRQVHPAWSHDKCMYESGWLNLHPNIRTCTLTLYASAVYCIQSTRVGQAAIKRDHHSGLPGSSPVDDAFKADATCDVAAAIIDVAPDGIKAPIDLDKAA